MSTMIVFIVGLMMGVVVAALSFCAVLARYKYEKIVLQRKLDAMYARVIQAEKLNALVTRNMLCANQRLAKLSDDADRLREEKLHAWDVPDEL
jgi:hypothetical protein